jgi:hypothetical protein
MSPRKLSKKDVPAASTLTIRGVEVPVENRAIEHDRLRFFRDNPRIYSIVRAGGHEPSQAEIEEQLLQLDHVRLLIADIRTNGGLTDPLVVIDRSHEVVEGNSRLAAYRYLSRHDPIRWSKVKCIVLPADIEQALLFALLGQYHIKGKKDWAPFEQAGFMYRRFKEHNVDLKTLASEIGLSTRKVKHLIDTYEFMLVHKETAVDRWSYYDEYLKSSKVRAVRDRYAEFDRLIVKKVRSGEIERAADLRDSLPAICESVRVLKQFTEGVIPFDEAAELADGGGAASTYLKRLSTFRKWVCRTEIEGLEADSDIRPKIAFELGKIGTRVSALRSKATSERSDLSKRAPRPRAK